MFQFRQLLFRSPTRDQETDNRRIELVQKAVHSAVADAETEVDGLQDRVPAAHRASAWITLDDKSLTKEQIEQLHGRLERVKS
jgi:hypothetical protein